MTRDEFGAALDRHGGDLARWPTVLKSAAEALIGDDPEAAAELDRAGRLETSLAEFVAPKMADAALIGRILAHRASMTSETALQPTRRAIGWATAAIAATLVAGFVAGALVPADESSDVLAALIFGGTDLEIGGDLL